MTLFSHRSADIHLWGTDEYKYLKQRNVSTNIEIKHIFTFIYIFSCTEQFLKR